MTTLQILKAARELLSTPERWTKGWSARDAAGNRLATTDPDAVCWCAGGAVERITGGSTQSGGKAEIVLAIVLPDKAICLGLWNDAPSTTHADILALYDRAIALEEARQ